MAVQQTPVTRRRSPRMQLDAALQQAISIWSGFLANPDQQKRLDGITAEITDLPDGALGEARGQTIYLDATAAGHGWFVDATADSSEFGIALDAERLVADTGSEAYGQIDLLTVLVHEVGHVLGFDHDSGLAVMGENLATASACCLPATMRRSPSLRQSRPCSRAPQEARLAGESDDGPINFRIFDSNSNDPGCRSDRHQR